MLDIDDIRIDGGTQARSELNEAVVAQYADAIAAGEKLPPVVTFFDGTDHWLADGFHRLFAHKKLEIAAIDAEIHSGTRRDAVLYSVGANRKHGLPPSNADKRKAVELLLNDAEWSKWSQQKIASTCGVSAGFVSKLVGELASIHGEEIKPKVRTVERAGKTYEQDTSNIGRQQAAAIAKHLPVATPATAALPAPVAADEPAQGPEDYTELDAARDHISELQAALAVAQMGDVAEDTKTHAAELIADLQAEIKTLQASLRAVQLSRDFLMEENAQMKTQMKMQRREIDRLKAGK